MKNVIVAMPTGIYIFILLTIYCYSYYPLATTSTGSG